MRIPSETVCGRPMLGTALIVGVVCSNELLATMLARGPRGTGFVHAGPETNAGSVFGFAQGGGLWLPIALVGLCVSVVVMRLTSAPVLSTALLAGGAAANTLQRATLHGVRDYVELGTVRGGVALNFADIALLVGAVLTTRHFFSLSDLSPNDRKEVN